MANAKVTKDYMFWGLFLVALTGLSYYNRQNCLSNLQRAREFGFAESSFTLNR